MACCTPPISVLKPEANTTTIVSIYFYITPTSISNFIYNNMSPVAVQLHLPFAVPFPFLSGFYKFFPRIITNSNNLLSSLKPRHNNNTHQDPLDSFVSLHVMRESSRHNRFVSSLHEGRQECVGRTLFE